MTQVDGAFNCDDVLWSLFDTMSRELAPEDVPTDPDEYALPSERASPSRRCVNDACDCYEFEMEETDTVCMMCGTVQSKALDFGAEWRYYGCDDNKSTNPTRCGMPTSEFLPKSSLGTVIGTERTNKHFFEMARIRKYHMWNSMPYKERSLYNVINRLNTKASTGGISSSIIEDAKVMYKKLSEMKISRGDNRNGLIASSIYMSCKNNGVPRSAKEVANIFNINITTMTRGCKKFHEIMKMNVASTSPEDFIVRFCSKLNRPDVVELALYVVRAADYYSVVSENAPPSIAAGSIYFCSVVHDKGITKKDIAKACEISAVTINKCYKKLAQYSEYLTPRDESL